MVWDECWSLSGWLEWQEKKLMMNRKLTWCWLRMDGGLGVVEAHRYTILDTQTRKERRKDSYLFKLFFRFDRGCSRECHLLSGLTLILTDPF